MGVVSSGPTLGVKVTLEEKKKLQPSTLLSTRDHQSSRFRQCGLSITCLQAGAEESFLEEVILTAKWKEFPGDNGEEGFEVPGSSLWTRQRKRAMRS